MARMKAVPQQGGGRGRGRRATQIPEGPTRSSGARMALQRENKTFVIHPLLVIGYRLPLGMACDLGKIVPFRGGQSQFLVSGLVAASPTRR